MLLGGEHRIDVRSMQVEDREMAVEQEVIVPETGQNQVSTNVPVKRKAGRPRYEERRFNDLPFETMSLADQIKLVSQRLSWFKSHAGSHQEFIELSRHLDELRSKLKPRHARSQNGYNNQTIQRYDRAKRMNEILEQRRKADGDGTTESGPVS